jgi:hypothetical protein
MLSLLYKKGYEIKSMDMKRRQFILVALSGVATVAIPMGFYGCSGTQYDEVLAKPTLLLAIWDHQAIAKIGKLYLEQYPGENTEQKLVELLSKPMLKDENDFTQALTSRIKEDYITGKIVTLDGWVLSVTEGRQCALFSLIQPKYSYDAY